MGEWSYTYTELWLCVNGWSAYVAVANFSVFSHRKNYISEFLYSRTSSWIICIDFIFTQVRVEPLSFLSYPGSVINILLFMKLFKWVLFASPLLLSNYMQYNFFFWLFFFLGNIFSKEVLIFHTFKVHPCMCRYIY